MQNLPKNTTESLYKSRSEDAQEILGQKLPWITRWGLLLVLLLCGIILLLSWGIQINGRSAFQVIFD